MEPVVVSKTRKEVYTRFNVIREHGRTVRKKAYVVERFFDSKNRIVEQLDYSYCTIKGRFLKKPGTRKTIYRYRSNIKIYESYTYPFKNMDYSSMEYCDADGKKEHNETWEYHSGKTVSLGKTFWKYDNKNRLIEEISLYPPAEDCDMRIRYTYDEHDRITKYTISGLNDDSPDEIIHEYDEKGRRIKWVNLLRGEVFNYAEYAYDGDGNTMEMREYSRDVPSSEPRLQTVIRYRYKIGKHKKTTYTDYMHYDKTGKVSTYQTIEIVRTIFTKTMRAHGSGSC